MRKIYDRSFSGKLINGEGVTAALLKKKGIRVVTQKNLDTKNCLVNPACFNSQVGNPIF